MFLKKRKVPAVLSTFLAACLLTGCMTTETQRQTVICMGTVMEYQLTYDANAKERTLCSNWIERGETLERDFLSRRLDSSEIAAINASAGSEEGYELSSEMEDLLTLCLSISEASEGAFDITLGSLVTLWDLDRWAEEGGEGFVPPTPEEVEEAKSYCGYEKVSIRDHRIYLPEGMVLDLGAVGKGYYLDRCSENSSEKGLHSAILTAGGSVLTISQNGQKTWKVGIVNPFRESGVYGILTFEGKHFVSTSGDYERYVEYDGIRFHHILDPATGYPADSGVRSVTIISDNGTLSDALSTACFVLGEEKGMELARKYGVDAIFILDNGEYVSTVTPEINENSSQGYIFSL